MKKRAKKLLALMTTTAMLVSSFAMPAMASNECQAWDPNGEECNLTWMNNDTEHWTWCYTHGAYGINKEPHEYDENGHCGCGHDLYDEPEIPDVPEFKEDPVDKEMMIVFAETCLADGISPFSFGVEGGTTFHAQASAEMAEALGIPVADYYMDGFDVSIALKGDTFEYTGAEIKPVELTDQLSDTVFGRYFDVSEVKYENNVNPGIATATVTIIGPTSSIPYTLRLKFEITEGSGMSEEEKWYNAQLFVECSLEMGFSPFVITLNEEKNGVNIALDDSIVSEVSEAKGMDIQLAPEYVAGCDVLLTLPLGEAYNFTGNALTPIVVENGLEGTPLMDFIQVLDVQYENNVDIGTATATLVVENYFLGEVYTLTETFDIVESGGADAPGEEPGDEPSDEPSEGELMEHAMIFAEICLAERKSAFTFDFSKGANTVVIGLDASKLPMVEEIYGKKLTLAQEYIDGYEVRLELQNGDEYAYTGKAITPIQVVDEVSDSIFRYFIEIEEVAYYNNVEAGNAFGELIIRDPFGTKMGSIGAAFTIVDDGTGGDESGTWKELFNPKEHLEVIIAGDDLAFIHVTEEFEKICAEHGYELPAETLGFDADFIQIDIMEDEYEDTGEPIEPAEIHIVYQGELGEDYLVIDDIQYENNIEPGTATVQVIFKMPDGTRYGLSDTFTIVEGSGGGNEDFHPAVLPNISEDGEESSIYVNANVSEGATLESERWELTHPELEEMSTRAEIAYGGFSPGYEMNVHHAWDLTLHGEYQKGEMSITFDVGEEYNGRWMWMFHQIDEHNYEMQKDMVEDGLASYLITSFSPFMLFTIDRKPVESYMDLFNPAEDLLVNSRNEDPAKVTFDVRAIFINNTKNNYPDLELPENIGATDVVELVINGDSFEATGEPITPAEIKETINGAVGKNYTLSEIQYENNVRPGTATAYVVVTLADGSELALRKDFTITGDEVLLGDVDGNGTVDTSDAQAIFNHFMGIQELSEAAQAYADVNGDGAVDTSDAQMAFNIFMGIQ